MESRPPRSWLPGPPMSARSLPWGRAARCAEPPSTLRYRRPGTYKASSRFHRAGDHCGLKIVDPARTRAPASHGYVTHEGTTWASRSESVSVRIAVIAPSATVKAIIMTGRPPSPPGTRTRASTTPSGPRGANRGRDPAVRPARRGHRRDLGRGHETLRRAAARGSGADGGDHQLLQPPQHHLPGAGRDELGLTPNRRSGESFDCVPGLGCLQTRRGAGEGRSPADQASCWDRYYSAKTQVLCGWRGPQCGTNDG